MIRRSSLLLSLATPLLSCLVACASAGDLDPEDTVIISTGGSAGSDGEAGEAGTAGTAGSGNAGAAGSGEAGSGQAGNAGAGQAGSGDAGTAGSGGTAGTSGEGSTGGTAGDGGTGGTAGNGGTAGDGGTGGTAGNGGTAGDGGTGGTAGNGGTGGTAGNGGSAGSGGTGGSAGSGGGAPTCAPLVFPSGTTIITKPNAAFTAEYEALNAASCVTPLCFIDTLDLRSPGGETYDINVKLAKNFTLYELVGTEVDPLKTKKVDAQNAYSTKVLVSPELIQYLQDMRENYGGAVNLNSGYRSPKHQKAVCQQICGADQCSEPDGTVTCAKLSRHMWGTAVDLDLKYEAAAKAVYFPFVFHETGGTGAHLHLDTQSCN